MDIVSYSNPHGIVCQSIGTTFEQSKKLNRQERQDEGLGDPGALCFGPIAMGVKDKGDKWEYKRLKGATGIKDMKIEWKKKEAKFDVHIDDAEIGLITS